MLQEEVQYIWPNNKQGDGGTIQDTSWKWDNFRLLLECDGWGIGWLRGAILDKGRLGKKGEYFGRGAGCRYEHEQSLN